MSDYFCQWCYDRGLRYADNGHPWPHAIDCPSNPQRKNVLEKSPDPTVARVCAQMVERSKAGLEKYGKTTAESPLSHREWLAHAEEEMTDAAIYLRRARETAEDTERKLAAMTERYNIAAGVLVEIMSQQDDSRSEHWDAVDYFRGVALDALQRIKAVSAIRTSPDSQTG